MTPAPSKSGLDGVLLGSWMLGMVMVWSAKTDDAVEVVEAGMRAAVTMGVHHASILASYDKSRRGYILDSFLHNTSQACFFHALYGIRLPIYPTQIDIAALVAICDNDSCPSPSQAMVSRADMHIKAWQTIERFYRSQDGRHLPAPSRSELASLLECTTHQGEEEAEMEYSRIVRLTAEIGSHLKEGQIKQRHQEQRNQPRFSPLGGAISTKGNAKLMLLLMRFLQVLINYPYSFLHEKARSVVCSVSRSIFGSAWNLASGDPTTSSSSSSSSTSSINNKSSNRDMDGTNELYVLVSLRCLLLLEQYTVTAARGDSSTIDDDEERLAVDTAFGKQAVTNLSYTLRMDSSALRECQRLLFHAGKTRIATFET